MQRHWILIGSVLGALGIVLGAFGAHGLTGFLGERHAEDPDLLQRRLGNWDTAALYHMYHAIAIVLTGVIGMFRRSKWLTIAGWSFLVGVLLFSGSLFALVLLEIPVLGAITPLGGIAFIVGWLALAIGGCCLSNEPVRLGDHTRSSSNREPRTDSNPYQTPNQD